VIARSRTAARLGAGVLTAAGALALVGVGSASADTLTPQAGAVSVAQPVRGDFCDNQRNQWARPCQGHDQWRWDRQHNRWEHWRHNDRDGRWYRR
jgi:hypothetical protein